MNANSKWIHGPAFLKGPETNWPQYKIELPLSPLEEEIKSCLFLKPQASNSLINFNRFSSYFKLKRTVAWLLRAKEAFLAKIRPTNSPSSVTNFISVKELDAAESVLCRLAQEETFLPEIRLLENNKPIPKQSCLYTLSPHLDNCHILRLKGRLDAAFYMPLEARQPILLPKNHALSLLILRHYHERNHHQNFNLTINEFRQRFWLPNIRSALKVIYSKCNKCIIEKAKPSPPFMGQLPADRVTPFVKPFTYTGVDLFGPLLVTIGRRKEKRWAVIFTCLTVRAAHIELAENLSTDAFIICLRNFVNRRGTPIRIRSDNGTNFIGAQKDLLKFGHFLDSDRIAEEAAKHHIEWLFNCPANPSSGGCWERLIRIVKRFLYESLKNEAPQLETLRSALIEAENIINSRPLTDIPIESEDEEPLTPNHFLMGGLNSTQVPHPEVTTCLRKQWFIAQNLKDRLWKRWTTEYLPQLLTRPKWHSQSPPIKLNDLVLVCELNLPRSQWPKGRITKLFPAKDGHIRLAEVQTANGAFRRPVSRLAILHLHCESD